MIMNKNTENKMKIEKTFFSNQKHASLTKKRSLCSLQKRQYHDSLIR